VISCSYKKRNAKAKCSKVRTVIYIKEFYLAKMDINVTCLFNWISFMNERH